MADPKSAESLQMYQIANYLQIALDLINKMDDAPRSLLENEWADIEEARDSIRQIAREIE